MRLKMAPIIVKIDLTRIQIPENKTRTIKKEKTYKLNIHRNVMLSKVRLQKEVERQLKIIEIVSCNKNPEEEYEMTLDFYPLPTTVMKNIEKMAQMLHLLTKDYDHVSNLKKTYTEETDFELKSFAKENFKTSTYLLKKKTKDIGRNFLSLFRNTCNHFHHKRSCLMLIFVEVVITHMKREKLDIKKPSRSRIEEVKRLFKEMINLNECNHYDNFFGLDNFIGLFKKAFSLSMARDIESPSRRNP